LHYQEYLKAVAERRQQALDRQNRERLNSNQRGYSYKWHKARKTYLMANPLCVKCGKPATEVDHITPHKGDMNLFWDVNNWQALCHECHSRKTYSEVRNQKKKPESDPDMNIFFIP
jgi:5-methylcytosine-specific restriction protein A